MFYYNIFGFYGELWQNALKENCKLCIVEMIGTKEKPSSNTRQALPTPWTLAAVSSLLTFFEKAQRIKMK